MKTLMIAPVGEAEMARRSKISSVSDTMSMVNAVFYWLQIEISRKVRGCTMTTMEVNKNTQLSILCRIKLCAPLCWAISVAQIDIVCSFVHGGVEKANEILQLYTSIVKYILSPKCSLLTLEPYNCSKRSRIDNFSEKNFLFHFHCHNLCALLLLKL